MTRDEAEQFVKKFEKQEQPGPAGPGREIKAKPGEEKVFDPNRKAPEFNTIGHRQQPQQPAGDARSRRTPSAACPKGAEVVAAARASPPVRGVPARASPSSKVAAGPDAAGRPLSRRAALDPRAGAAYLPGAADGLDARPSTASSRRSDPVGRPADSHAPTARPAPPLPDRVRPPGPARTTSPTSWSSAAASPASARRSACPSRSGSWSSPRTRSARATAPTPRAGSPGVLDPEDHFEDHIADTLAAGKGLCDPEVVELVVREAPRRIGELIEWGTIFDQVNGQVALTREGGHSHPRIVHALGDATGREVMRAVIQKARDRPERPDLAEQLHDRPADPRGPMPRGPGLGPSPRALADLGPGDRPRHRGRRAALPRDDQPADRHRPTATPSPTGRGPSFATWSSCSSTRPCSTSPARPAT